MDIDKYRQFSATNLPDEGLTEFFDTQLAPSEAVYKLYDKGELVYVSYSRCICRMTFHHKFYFDRIDIAYYCGSYIEDEVDKIIFSEKPKYNKKPFTRYTLKTAISHYNKVMKRSGIKGRMTKRKMHEALPGKIYEYKGIEYILAYDLESLESSSVH